jgi:hypothetical protein
LNRFGGWFRFGSAAGLARSGHKAEFYGLFIGMQGVKYAKRFVVNRECATRMRTLPARKNKVK